ncbi:hypothetical protein [Vibrio sp. WXL103]|uniref:hypothetical protein n=1 Tax=Vibrio sp. WXL103 TaxID=3450710 RepID=UPI003EC63ACC
MPEPQLDSNNIMGVYLTVRVSYCAGEYQVDDQERSESTQEIMIYSQVALSELLDAPNSEK